MCKHVLRSSVEAVDPTFLTAHPKSSHLMNDLIWGEPSYHISVPRQDYLLPISSHDLSVGNLLLRKNSSSLNVLTDTWTSSISLRLIALIAFLVNLRSSNLINFALHVFSCFVLTCEQCEPVQWIANIPCRTESRNSSSLIKIHCTSHLSVKRDFY